MGDPYTMKIKRLPKQQKGLTLIEILIALLLGAFLIGGVLEIFVNTRETYRMQEALSRLQENGRFAMEFIGRDIRMAGYSFCPRPLAISPLEPAVPNPLSATPTAFFLNGTNGNLNGANQDSPDSISIQWIGGETCPQTAADRVSLTYDVFANPATGLMELRRDPDDAGPAVPVALIEGVENMQILYGYDTDESMRGTPEFYGVAGQVADIRRVVSVRVSLLLYSTDPFVLDVPASPLFNNEVTNNVAPRDRRVRRVFTSTFTLRNRYDVAG